MTVITLNISDYRKLKTDLADLLEKGRQQAQEAVSEVANHTGNQDSLMRGTHLTYPIPLWSG